MAWKLAISKLFPLHQQKVRKSKDDYQSSSNIVSYRAHSDLTEGIYCKKYQYGPKTRNWITVSKIHKLLNIRHFHVEAPFDTTYF